jgi:hypothetical protein
MAVWQRCVIREFETVVRESKDQNLGVCVSAYYGTEWGNSVHVTAL